SLDVQFNNYDAFGNPTEVVDANGVSTLLSFEENRVISRTVNGNTTRYAYDNVKLSLIQYPEGNYEVFCYRTGTSGTGCTEGTWSEKLQWRAKSGVSDGATWSEKVSYTYASDGTIATQSFLDAAGQLRRIRRYASDPQRRPTAARWGDLTDHPEVRVYDPA